MNTHPTWCEPSRCEAGLGGAHSSEPQSIDFDRRGNAMARVRIWRRPPYVDKAGMDRHQPPTLVELVVGDVTTGSRCRADLTVPQARQLNARLTSALMRTGDDDE